MHNYIIEAIVTLTDSVCHNAGQSAGTVVQFRREKRIMPDGKKIDIPVISGNSLRGKLRDICAMQFLRSANGEKSKLDERTFNLMFSGGSLRKLGEKEKDSDLCVEKIREMRKNIPFLSLLGCSVGNLILPGKVDIGKLIPIAKETLHLLPDFCKSVFPENSAPSVWSMCQLEMYTRKDDCKDENKRQFLIESASQENSDDEQAVQMKYEIETICAGSKFYWKICLKDCSDEECGAFLSALNEMFSDAINQIGGNGRIGHGSATMQIVETKRVDLLSGNPDFVRFVNAFNNFDKSKANKYVEKGVDKNLFG